jgi:serine kinase of HPr protein (carbohydrate metabolism regulator)
VTGAPQAPVNRHATALVYDGIGVLITGPSGAGKSLLALDLIDHAALAGAEAFLIADDQVLLEADGDSLRAAAPPTTAGHIELRGRGIVARPHVNAVPVHLVLELVAELDRMPPPQALATDVAGVPLARAPLPAAGVGDATQRRLLALQAIATCRGSLEKTT